MPEEGEVVIAEEKTPPPTIETHDNSLNQSTETISPPGNNEKKTQPVASLQLREFSKANSKAERDEAARAIREERAKYFDEKKNLSEIRGELASSIPELEGKIGSDIEELRNIGELVDSLSTNWFSRTVNFLELSRVTSKIDRLNAQRKLDESELFRLKYRDSAIEARLSNPQRYNIESGRQLLEDFYDRERRKWERSPMSKEDLDHYFSEEYLTSLSNNDYSELMNRYSGYSVAHVTRQGIRDHTGHSNHTSGVGEFHDGFTKILKDGELKSVFGRYLRDGTRREIVTKFLDLEGKSEEEAKSFLNREIGGRFADFSSVHFAVGRVQEDAYGGETDNEIYFTFPSAFIAKNFYYQGGVASLSMGLDSHHNDQWVFPRSIDTGININAGRVYLPDEVRVDPRNGSKYQLDENRVPVKEGEAYRLAENTVSAREYWEKYFTDNPDQRPKHIIWYSGVPWLYQDHKKNDYDEFPEHQDVPPSHDELRTAFYDPGKSVIDEYYGVMPKASI